MEGRKGKSGKRAEQGASADQIVTVTVTRTNDTPVVAAADVTGAVTEQVTPVGLTLTADGKTAIVALGRANHVAFVAV